MDNTRFDRFLTWFIEKNFLAVRSLMLYAAFYSTMYVTRWAIEFANANATMSGTELGLKIMAVTAPITAFTGFVYKFYSDSRPANGS